MGLGFDPSQFEDGEEDDFDKELDSIGYEEDEPKKKTVDLSKKPVANSRKQTSKKELEEEYEDDEDDEDDYEGGGKKNILGIIVAVVIIALLILGGYKVITHVFGKQPAKQTQVQTTQQPKQVQSTGGSQVSVNATPTQQPAQKQYPNSLELANANEQPASTQTVNGQLAPAVQTGKVVDNSYFKSYDGSPIPTNFEATAIIKGTDFFQYKKVRSMTAPGLEKLSLVGTYHDRPYSIPVTFGEWQLLPNSGTASVDVEELILKGGKTVVCSLQINPKYIEELQQSKQAIQPTNTAQ